MDESDKRILQRFSDQVVELRLPYSSGDNALAVIFDEWRCGLMVHVVCRHWSGPLYFGTKGVYIAKGAVRMILPTTFAIDEVLDEAPADPPVDDSCPF